MDFLEIKLDIIGVAVKLGTVTNDDFLKGQHVDQGVN